MEYKWKKDFVYFSAFLMLFFKIDFFIWKVNKYSKETRRRGDVTRPVSNSTERVFYVLCKFEFPFSKKRKGRRSRVNGKYISTNYYAQTLFNFAQLLLHLHRDKTSARSRRAVTFCNILPHSCEMISDQSTV